MKDVANGPVAWLVPELDSSELRRWSRWAGLVLFAYLAARAPVLLAEPSAWNPVGILSPLTQPLARWIVAATWLMSVVWAFALASDPRGLSPWLLRGLSPFGAVALLVLVTHRSSSGQILWFDILMILHMLVIAAGTMASSRLLAGWALRLGGLITVVTYVLAGIAKLRIGGMDWVREGALELHIAWSATRAEVLGSTASPLAGPLVELGFASTPLALIVLAIELCAPVALVNRRCAIAWSIAAWTMHLGIAASMFVVFHWPVTGAAFLPLVLIAPRPGRQSAAVLRSGHANSRSLEVPKAHPTKDRI